MIEGNWQIIGQGITGYARDTQSPGPLWVELLADNISMGIAIADLAEPGGCGFYLPIPPALLEEDAPLSVRIVNSDIFLEQKGDVEESQGQGLLGEFYLDRGLTFTGWAIDAGRRDRYLHIYAYADQKEVGHTIAAGRCFRPAQADNHGFQLDLADWLADGQMHVIELKDGDGRPLPGSPVRVCTHPDRASKWLKQQKKIDKPVLDLICNMMEITEERLPGIMGHLKYDLWKKAFPVQTGAKGKSRLALSGDRSLLKGQLNIELKQGKDAFFSAGTGIRLHNQALSLMSDALQQYDAALVYCDSETPAQEGLFKPAWDREAFLQQDYLGPCLISGKYIEDLQPTEEGRLEAILQAASQGPVVHLPLTLSIMPEPEVDADRMEQVGKYLAKTGSNTQVDNGRLKYQGPKPLVSIIIPTRDHGDLLKVCLDSLWKTSWPALEIIIVDNGTVEEEALAVLAHAATHPNVEVMPWPGQFNYAAINNEAVQRARGELVCFLNNDTEAISPDWLEEMAGLLMATDAGCVGVKLLWPNGLVQHGGVIIGPHQLAAHVGNQWLADEPGYMNRNLVIQQYSAVTAACLLTPRSLFLELGGFDTRQFPIAFNDVDYCLRAREKGKAVYWTPHAILKHHESASRGKDILPANRARSEREMRAFRTKWGAYLDPFYNPNLHLSAISEPFLGLAFPPRSRLARVSYPKHI